MDLVSTARKKCGDDVQETGSIVSAFRRLCESDPEAVLFTFVDDKGRDHETLTVGELAAAADGIGKSLRSWGVQAGDRAVLVYMPSLDFVKAFLGCLAAGVLPVPVCPPNPFKLKHDMATLRTIVDSCAARVVLSNTDLDRALSLADATGEVRWPEIPWYQTDRCQPGSATPAAWHTPATADTPAFLQYTSGSTGSAKGVIITHGNLWHEMRANAVDLDLGPDTRGVFWLPHFHDLGLITVILNTVVGNGLNTHLMSPLTFMKRPAIWFEVISRIQATHTAAPNFAYELLVRKTSPEQRRSWDLSSLRLVGSAGEQVRPATVRTFLDAFADSKLRPDAFYAGYGLAECSVSVSVGGRTVLRLDKQQLEEAGCAVPLDDASDRPSASYFSCGRVTKPGAYTRIVDPDTCRPCPPGHVGEIWVDSPTNAAGYWGLIDETDEVFRARCHGEHPPREYLRTGDLGFFFDGELFVTGRHKDLIIVRGHNRYSQDIEDSAREAHPFVRPGGLAAFSVPPDDDDSSDERLVLFVEVRQGRLDAEDLEAILCGVRRRVQEDHQITCHAVVLGTAGTVKKTTSGKIRRSACRRAYLSGEIHAAKTTIGVFPTARQDVRGMDAAR
ncbi:fatty acyl-AMP ligase [Kibdelosporangium philippinense]|uniref:Fatty acyl-AMP ligase n=1 Tax=Kibdelosporangium philippinense TaxID=211113 RepID=A0ABS8Z8F5_9PSEU|nr:fatty acyl-AMP ligase [Kibdelosporangium philippinense]MCE7002112.1 fatty acyl-AMP ligase [Kibdelosporangium philippinense]